MRRPTWKLTVYDEEERCLRPALVVLRTKMLATLTLAEAAIAVLNLYHNQRAMYALVLQI